MPRKNQIHVFAKPYNGKDPRKINKHRAAVDAARQIEHYLNERLLDDQPHVFHYYELASNLGIDIGVVRRLLTPRGGGYNGITL